MTTLHAPRSSTPLAAHGLRSLNAADLDAITSACVFVCQNAHSPPTSRRNHCARRRQTAIRDAGADNIALVQQGRLVAGDVIAEAGLSAQPKAKPPKM